MSSATAPAAGTGLPTSIEYAAALLPEGKLAKLSNANLFRLSAVLRGACDMFAHSTAALTLDDLNGVLIEALCNIADVVERRMPTDPKEANWRGWLLAQHAAFVSADLNELAAQATEASALQRQLARQSR